MRTRNQTALDLGHVPDQAQQGQARGRHAAAWPSCSPVRPGALGAAACRGDSRATPRALRARRQASGSGRRTAAGASQASESSPDPRGNTSPAAPGYRPASAAPLPASSVSPSGRHTPERLTSRTPRRVSAPAGAIPARSGLTTSGVRGAAGAAGGPRRGRARVRTAIAGRRKRTESPSDRQPALRPGGDRRTSERPPCGRCRRSHPRQPGRRRGPTRHPGSGADPVRRPAPPAATAWAVPPGRRKTSKSISDSASAPPTTSPRVAARILRCLTRPARSRAP